MPGYSEIEWTDATWNPVTGCTKVSPGCKHCYAETFAERWRGIPGHPYEQGFDLKLWPARLDIPLRWTKPRRIFVNSMSDLFHKDVPDGFIEQVFDVMERAHWHTFQVLTKRAERMSRMNNRVAPNIWLGVSVEDEQRKEERIGPLQATAAGLRFLSCEPLLGPLGTLNLDGIGWVIVGGESGHGARPMDPAWAREIRDQCLAQRVPFFFKQWGGVHKKEAGRELDGREWSQFPA